VNVPAHESATEVLVHDDRELNRYEAHVGADLAGFAEYHRQPGLVTVLHSEIDPEFEGRGIGSALVRGMLDDIRRQEEKVLPVCPFVTSFLQRHTEYADLVWTP
jgi:uncharacterized protein